MVYLVVSDLRKGKDGCVIWNWLPIQWSEMVSELHSSSPYPTQVSSRLGSSTRTPLIDDVVIEEWEPPVRGSP